MPFQSLTAKRFALKVYELPVAANRSPLDSSVDIRAPPHVAQELSLPALLSFFLFCSKELIKSTVKPCLTTLDAALHVLVDLIAAVYEHTGIEKHFEHHVVILVRRVVFRVEVRSGLHLACVFFFYLLLPDLLQRLSIKFRLCRVRLLPSWQAKPIRSAPKSLRERGKPLRHYFNYD